MNYSTSKVTKIFSLQGHDQVHRSDILEAEIRGSIPKQSLIPIKRRQQKLWTPEQIPQVGEVFGFMEKPNTPVVCTVFVTKGGVLKSTLTLNFARLAALHNIKTCVVGLDMQGDITSALGYDYGLSEEMNIEDALEQINQTHGLMELFNKELPLEDLILSTDLPTLKFIPETPELVNLNQMLNLKNRREFWLKENVIEPLKSEFDLILFDCPPNWNQLITNALNGCDTLISPLECKINNFRNLKMFQSFIGEFKSEMKLDFLTQYTPTRYTPNKKLSSDILNWYQSNIEGCSKHFIRESLHVEEACALFLSASEYSPLSQSAQEVKLLVDELWQNILSSQNKTRNLKTPHTDLSI